MSIKNLSILLGCLATLAGGFIGYGQLIAKAGDNEQEVVEVKSEAAKLSDKLTNEEKINVEQSVILRQTVETLNKLNDKIDKKR